MYILVTFLILNALAGILTVNWLWKKLERIRDVQEDRDSLFPAFRRLDAGQWRKWHFYPLACTIMLPKLIIAFSLVGVATVCSKIFLMGRDKTQPIQGVRKFIILNIYWLISRIIVLVTF